MKPFTAFGSGTKKSGGPNFWPGRDRPVHELAQRRALSPELVGTITYVNVEIGYAFLPHFAGGSTILSCVRAVTFAGRSQSAAVTPRTPGVAFPPALFLISANWNLFVIEYAAST